MNLARYVAQMSYANGYLNRLTPRSYALNAYKREMLQHRRPWSNTGSMLQHSATMD